MKYILFFSLFIYSTVTPANHSSLHQLKACKKEVRDMRADYVDIVLGKRTRLAKFLTKAIGLEDLQYHLMKGFSYRPWLKKVKLSEKLGSCLEVKSLMSREFAQPKGIESFMGGRSNVSDQERAQLQQIHRSSVEKVRLSSGAK